jgi:hypothetical protein
VLGFTRMFPAQLPLGQREKNDSLVRFAAGGATLHSSQYDTG